MTRRAAGKPDNPWQRATALGKRLGLIRVGDRATWTHPDRPDVTYSVEFGDESRWTLTIGADVETGSMDAATAALYVETARLAEPRRLAAWKMLNALALEGARWTQGDDA